MKLGLRAKSTLVLCGSILVVLCLAGLFGWRAIEAIEVHLGTAYANNFTQYNKVRILAPIERELALSQRLADSDVTRAWVLHEADPKAKAAFFAEAERYRKAFEGKAYFLIIRGSRHYYYNSAQHPVTEKPQYSLNPKQAGDGWFFSSMSDPEPFNLNVDYDRALKITEVWFNVSIFDHGQKIGMAGTDLDLTGFLKRFIQSGENGVTPMILNPDGAIQAHPEKSLIDYSSVDQAKTRHSTVFALLDSDDDRATLRDLIAKAIAHPNQTPGAWVSLQGRRQWVALSYVSDLKWLVVTAIDLKAARVLDTSLWLPPLVGAVLLMVLMAGAIGFGVNNLLIAPVLALTASVRRMSAGNYDVRLPEPTSDELGELTRAFGVMAEQVRTHTDELEAKVQERTRELVAVNEQITAANRKLADGIAYASLIQDSILPRKELSQALGEGHFVLWRPRDVVGGDLYIFRSVEGGCLLGVIDCAGHGVAGAFMTMIAHAVINMAIDDLGATDPAAILARMDSHTRAILQADERYAHVATSMDAGLAYADFSARTVTFAGAKVSLYFCEGHDVEAVPGDRFTIGGKRPPVFTNRISPLRSELTFYLTTDGLLDQAGGASGFSFGQSRFESLLRRHSALPIDEQKAALDSELAEYQGQLPQRDDITVLCFRFTLD